MQASLFAAKKRAGGAAAAGLSSAHWPQSRSRSANSKVARASSHYDRSITAALTTRLKSRKLPTLTYQIAALCRTAIMPDVSAPTASDTGNQLMRLRSSAGSRSSPTRHPSTCQCHTRFTPPAASIAPASVRLTHSHSDGPSPVEGFPMRSWNIEIWLLDDQGNEVMPTVYEKAVYNLHPSFERPKQSECARAVRAEEAPLTSVQQSRRRRSASKSRDGESLT